MNKNKWQETVIIVLVMGFWTLALQQITGCKTVNPTTGQAQYDPVKTAQVEAAFVPLASSTIRRLIKHNPTDATKIAEYFRAGGRVFKQMVDQKKFDPVYLVQQLDLVIPIRNDTILDVKNLIVAMYTVFYGDRVHAELPEDQWVIHVANTFAKGIDQGLKDAGFTGL